MGYRTYRPVRAKAKGQKEGTAHSPRRKTDFLCSMARRPLLLRLLLLLVRMLRFPLLPLAPSPPLRLFLSLQVPLPLLVLGLMPPMLWSCCCCCCILPRAGARQAWADAVGRGASAES